MPYPLRTSRMMLVALAAHLFIILSAQGQPVLYVDGNATGPVHDGSSWCQAYVHLQDALAAAAISGGTVTEIRVAQGLYAPDRGGDETPGDQQATFQLLNGVTIAGGYAGCVAPDPDDRNVDVYETILSGDLLANDTGSPEDVSRNDNSLHVVTGSGTEPTATLDGFTICRGGGRYGSTSNAGGGMINEAGSPTVANCTFRDNHAFGGGGMANYDSHPLVTNCTFINNSGGKGGGMANGGNGTPTVIHCRFYDNHGRSGGAMYNSNGAATVTNCLFVGNTASHGAGIENWNGGHATITSCTFSENSAIGGPAVACGAASGLDPSSAELTNCILVDGGDELEYFAPNTITITYSAIQGGAEGEGNTDQDPLFVPGPVGCYYLSQIAAGHAANSPCVDAGSDTAVNLELDTLTTRSDEGVDIDTVDMGYHYPVTGQPLLMGDYDRSGQIDLADFAGLQNCFTGDGPTEVTPCCRIFDFEPDTDVDLTDYATFEAALMDG